jgi:ferrous iron transport protein B
MVPCNGRFPTLILLGTMFFSGVGASFVVAVCVIAGVVGAMAVSGVLSKTVLRHERSVFLMEMPPFRRPRFGQILVRSLLDRTLHIAGRALKVAAPAGALLWCLANTNILSWAASILEPFGRILGMSGVIMLGFIFSFPANELFVPVVLMVLSGITSLQGAGTVDADMMILAGYTWKTAVCTMVFSLFHWPCATTLMTIHKETGSIKETAAAFFLPTAVGTVLCMMIHLVLSAF